MSELLNLAKEFAHRDATPFGNISGAFMYSDETPAHRFATVIAPILNCEYFVVVPSRDFFDESLAIAILTFVANRESTFTIEKTLVLLDGFDCPQCSFDAVAVLSPAAARQFEHENDMLNKRAFVAFPIYRCELSGDESPHVVDLIRHDLLPSLDWKRAPCPKVTIGYRNKRNKAGSRPRLTKLATVLYEVDELNGSEGSWMEIENYAGRRCRVVVSQGRYTVEFPAQDATPVDKSVLIDRIKRFVMHDQDKPGPP